MTDTVQETDGVVGSTTTWLFKEDNPDRTYWVGFEIKPDRLIVHDFEMGEGVEDRRGDSDIEHYVTIQRAEVAEFILACCALHTIESVPENPSDAEVKQVMHQVFDGQKNTIFQVKDILKNNNITYDFQIW